MRKVSYFTCRSLIMTEYGMSSVSRKALTVWWLVKGTLMSTGVERSMGSIHTSSWDRREGSGVKERGERGRREDAGEKEGERMEEKGERREERGWRREEREGRRREER